MASVFSSDFRRNGNCSQIRDQESRGTVTGRSDLIGRRMKTQMPVVNDLRHL